MITQYRVPTGLFGFVVPALAFICRQNTYNARTDCSKKYRPEVITEFSRTASKFNKTLLRFLISTYVYLPN